MSSARPLSAPRTARPAAARRSRASAPYGPTLTLTLTLAVGCFLVLMPAVLLVVHPVVHGLGVLAGSVDQQNQTAKTFLYVTAFAVILPLSVLGGSRLTARIASGPNEPALAALTGILAAALAADIIVIRLSGALPWHDGLKAVLAGAALWSLIAGVVLRRAARPASWPLLLRLQGSARTIAFLAGVLVFGTLLCLSSVGALSAVALVLGAGVALTVTVAFERLRLPRAERWPGRAIDAVLIVVLLFAIPDMVVFPNPSGLPNIFVEPGIIQYQHDFLLGPANQLLGGGALLVNVPVSQYGVGSIDFLAGWFHLVPIGYGTFGFLDGLLTALFYIAGYCVLRIAGAGRLLAGGAMAVAVLTLIYTLYYAVGALPEQGPLRFGLPMVVVLAAVAASRWPQHARAARVLALCGVGVAAIWALEAFVYTLVTFVALAALEAWLAPVGDRRRLLGRLLGLGLVACVTAHVLFALATLVGSGHLPDWGQYLAYARAVLPGGRSAFSYGFARWSPGLAVGAGALCSAAAIVLLMRLAPTIVRRHRTTILALAGTTAYSIAMLSYTDNRSSTYLLPYVGLPLVLAGVLWLVLLVRTPDQTPSVVRRGGLGFALSVAVLLLASGWPSIGGHFQRSALAHAYPGGGLTAELHRLWHPPAIDPRAPEGERLLARYMPARRSLILLPTVPDLGTEILIRSRRANSLFIGDPKADGLVRSVWRSKVTRQIAALRSGQRLLIDRAGLTILAQMRTNPDLDPLTHQFDGGVQEVEWILREIDRRFRLQPVHEDPDGLIVAKLMARTP